MKESQVNSSLITCEFSDVTIANSLNEAGWLSVLSGSALKLYLYYADLKSKGIPLTSNNKKFKQDLDFSKSTAGSAPKELEAFGLIRCIFQSENGSKIFELNNRIFKLPAHWLALLKKNEYRKFCLSVLSNEVDNDLVQAMAEKCLSSEDINIQKTIGKLILAIYDETDIDMEFLLKEEYTMEDLGLSFEEELGLSDDVTELFSAEELGYYKSIEDDKRWQKHLNEKDLENEAFCGIVELYYVHFGMPTEKDIIDMRESYKKCYPSQVKAAIIKVSTGKQYEGKVKDFHYILSLLEKGMFGTRASKGKGKNGGFKTKDDKRTISLKDTNKSGDDMIKALENQLGKGIVDFNAVFGNN